MNGGSCPINGRKPGHSPEFVQIICDQSQRQASCMSSNEQVHCSNQIAVPLEVRSDVAIVGSGFIIERAYFKRGEKFHQRLPILFRISAFRSPVLQFSNGDRRDYKIRRTELLHLLDNPGRTILNGVNTDVRIQHEEHHQSSLSARGGWCLFPSI